jgi:hypothetical protein
MSTTNYPEQQTPPSPSYAATIRGVNIGGWLYYHPTNGDPDNGRIELKVTIDGKQVHTEDFLFTDADARPAARQQAKNTWRNAVLSVLAGV